jgi:hypothetical protein
MRGGGGRVQLDEFEWNSVPELDDDGSTRCQEAEFIAESMRHDCDTGAG